MMNEDKLMDEQIEILRRIVESGMSEVIKANDDKYVDLFQHLLDEIERLKLMGTESVKEKRITELEAKLKDVKDAEIITSMNREGG